ncbi:hypothetical protein D9619_002048 [Psilocybe cf. subviscida]|uniref:BTB domain-containing protein n=1 Tax=Psilocybe cf. subviscida TaxID=2480587 RepID=A0A8H5F4G0_9AGAR|nr:hypothetical protein D9619_002048 [Psilocybe cf. subviscida]
MPPMGSPNKEPAAPGALLAHIPTIHSLTNSPTSSAGSGSMLDWTTSAGSSDMFDLTSSPPHHTFTPVLDALPTPPSTATSPRNGAAAPPPPPHIQMAPAPASHGGGGAHKHSSSAPLGAAQTGGLAINWDELTFPTDWISPSPSVSGEARISRPSSTPPSARDGALPRELVHKAFAVLQRLSMEDIPRDYSHAGSGEGPAPAPAHTRKDVATSSPANARREVTSVGTPSRRPSPVPTVLNEDEEAMPGLRPCGSSSEFDVFVEHDTVDDGDARSDYRYQQLRPSDSVLMASPGQPTVNDSRRSPSANSALSYFSPPVSPRLRQFVDVFRRLEVAQQAFDRELDAAERRPSTRSSSPPSPHVSTAASSNAISVGNQNELFSPTRSIPVGSILSATASADSETRVPKPRLSSASLAALLQFQSSTYTPTSLEPEPARGRQRFRRDFPPSTESPVVRLSGLPSYAQTESTAAPSVNLAPESAPALLTSSSSSTWVSPQPWTGMSVTQPLATSEPLTKYGRKAHPLPPTPPIPSQTGNMFTSHPLFWTEPVEPATGGPTATEQPAPSQRTQRQRPPLPPVPVDFSAQPPPPFMPPMSPFTRAVKAGDRTFPAYTDALPSAANAMPYMPANTIPSGFQPWANSGYFSRANVPWSPLAPAIRGMNNTLANSTSPEHNDPSNPLYSTNRGIWSPPTYAYPLAPIAPQPISAPPAFMSSSENYGMAMTAAMMTSPNVSATSPFIPSLNDLDDDTGAYPSWTGHPAPTGVRFISPLPSPASTAPSTPRLAAATTESGRHPWAQTAYYTGEHEDRDRRSVYDSAGVRFAPPPPPPPPPSSYATEDGYSYYAPVIPVIPPHLPPVPPAPSMLSDSQWITASRKYAFNDASVAFKVEQTLFKVHRSFFERHSNYFRRILAGYSYASSNPVSLPDVKKLDFERLLSIFYPSDLSKPDITTLKGWLAVLALSQKWEMDQIKRLCVRHIGHLAWPMEKVIIAHKYDLHNAGPSWLFAAYKEVCTRSVPLPLRDAEQLSMEIVVSIWEVQHEVSTMRLRGESIETTEKRVEELVKEKFGHFEADTPPTTPTGRMPSFSSWQ